MIHEKSNIRPKYLGKNTRYPNTYDPSLLQALLRFDNRQQYDIPEKPDFTGFDVWHAYEFGFITKNGLPVTGMLKLRYESSNLYIIESKSLKLYLNSFNMDRFGDNRSDGIKIVLDLIQTDLENALNTNVELNFFDKEQDSYSDFSGYNKLEELINTEIITFNDFNENPALLQSERNTPQDLRIYTDILRSNCKVTRQPDWGSVFIRIKSKESIKLDSLMKYLVSFRNENHFHEEICEIIYKRLFDFFAPDDLMVACIYTRRGGIDICPVRANKMEILPNYLTDPSVYDKKLLRQ